MNRLCVFLSITLIGVLMAIQAWNDSTVYNENGRLASGVLYFHTGDYSAFRVNPPLMSLVGAIPSVVSGSVCPTRSELGYSKFGRDESIAGKVFVNNNSNYHVLLFFGRLCCIIVLFMSVIGTLRHVILLNGKNAPYLFIVLLLLSPYFLGHGHLISSDVAAGVFALLAFCFFRRWLYELSYRTAVLAGVVLGLAELTKFTLLILYPIMLVLWGIYRAPKIGIPCKVPWSSQFLQWIVICSMSLLVINIGYAFEGTGKPLRDFQFQTTLFSGYPTRDVIPFSGGNRFDGCGSFAEKMLGYLPMPLPQNFIQGIDTQRFDFEEGKLSYMRGTWSDHGWWYYYLYAILLKNPLGSIGLFLLAIFCSLFLKGYNAGWRDEMLLLFPGVAFLTFVSSQTGFSIHSRYVIPALFFFFLWSTKVARAFEPVVKSASPKTSCVVRSVAVLLLIWSVWSSLWVYPHSLSYFNELAAILPTPESPVCPRSEPEKVTAWQRICHFLNAGPINGPRHLLGSEVDWGQDIGGLRRWYNKHQDAAGMMTIDCFDSLDELTSISHSIPEASDKTMPRWYAVNVNRLYGVDKKYHHFLEFTPESMIGYSIYVYHISPEELERFDCPNTEKETAP